MLRFIYWIFIILFFSVPVFSTGVSGNNKSVDASSVIQVEDNLLTVKAGDIPLKKVLIEIAKQKNIKIKFYASVEDSLISNFSSLPMEKGLAKLLRNYNYTLIKGEEHEIRKVIIISNRGESRHSGMEPVIAYTEELPLYENPYDEDIMTSAEDAPDNIRSEIVLDPLRDALQDEDAGVRLSAVGALGVIGGDRAIQALEEALKDNDEAVKVLAAIGLRRLKGEG